jgi:hypothetical protein
MLTICADAISASRPGARRDTLATYLARLEQLQSIATRHAGVERAFPLQAGREVRIFVRAKQVRDAQVPELSVEIAREIENEMQYPGIIKVTVIRETTATATAPAQIAAVQEANRRRANGGDANGKDEDGRGTGRVAVAEHDDASSDLPVTTADGDDIEDVDGADAEDAHPLEPGSEGSAARDGKR